MRVKRAVSANAGFYTVPSFDVPFPFGLGGTQDTFSEEDMRAFLRYSRLERAPARAARTRMHLSL